MNIQPLADHVVIKPSEESEEKTKVVSTRLILPKKNPRKDK